MAIDLEIHRPPSVLVGVADRGERDDQRLARFEIDPDFLSRIQAIEICGAVEDGDVLVPAQVDPIIVEHARVEGSTDRLVPRDPAAVLLRQIVGQLLQIHNRQPVAGPARQGRLALKDRRAKILGEPTGWLAELPLEIAGDTRGEVERLRLCQQLRARSGDGLVERVAHFEKAVLHQEDGEIADHLARRRHLGNVADELVDGGERGLHVVPAVEQPHLGDLRP